MLASLILTAALNGALASFLGPNPPDDVGAFFFFDFALAFVASSRVGDRQRGDITNDDTGAQTRHRSARAMEARIVMV